MPHQLPHDHGQNVAPLLAGLPHTEDFQALASLFRQLSDGSRLRLFWLLCHCRECVTNLSAMMGMSAPVDDAVAMRRGALLGALTLYLDFINMFLMMLRLFGNRE